MCASGSSFSSERAFGECEGEEDKDDVEESVESDEYFLAVKFDEAIKGGDASWDTCGVETGFSVEAP